MFGVMGNIALASILPCVQHVIKPEEWCPVLVRTAFWNHMWMEVMFEIFTTLLVAYSYREMGILSNAKAERALRWFSSSSSPST